MQWKRGPVVAEEAAGAVEVDRAAVGARVGREQGRGLVQAVGRVAGLVAEEQVPAAE
jgi:hypothetical protein